MIPAILAVTVGAAFVVWQTVIAAPALDFGGQGAVHFKDSEVSSGTKPLLCFDAIEWRRLCPGQTFTKLTPVNVSNPKVGEVDLDPHVISTPLELGKLPAKCRASPEIPIGISPGIWRLTGHASSTCTMWMPLVGSFTVTVMSEIPSTLVSIKAP